MRRGIMIKASGSAVRANQSLRGRRSRLPKRRMWFLSRRPRRPRSCTPLPSSTAKPPRRRCDGRPSLFWERPKVRLMRRRPPSKKFVERRSRGWRTRRMLLRRRRLSIRPRRCLGRSNLGVSCIFLFVSRRWRFDAARLCVVWLGRGPRLPHRLLSNTCAASVSPAASFIFFVVLVGLLRLQAGTSTEESSRACKSPIHHIHETTHVNCSGVARRIDCRAQRP